MNTQYKIGLAVILLLAAFATGRYTATSTNTQTITKTDETQLIDSGKHKETTITKETKKDGTKTEVVKIIEDTHKNVKKTKESEAVTIVEVKKTSTAHLSFLAGYNYKRAETEYGIHFTKQVLGPVNIGLYGMNSGTVGLSVGLEF